MSNILVAYFSPTGTTKKVAEIIAEVTGAEMHEIKPVTPYTGKDLNWNDKNSRSTLEMQDEKSRPELADKNAAISAYDVIYLGFPIWWYVAPRIINTFLENYNFNGKTIVIFATSGGSGFGDTLKHLKNSCPGAKLIEGHVFRGRSNKDAVTDWIKSIKF